MESKKNKSRTYFVPLVDNFIEVHKSLLINTYMYSLQYPEYNLPDVEGIFMYFKWSDNDVHRMYEQKLLDSPYLKLHFDVDKDTYMVFVKFPEEVINDVNKILDGKYSKITDNSKKLIVKYWCVTSTSDLYGTLFKTKARKEKLEESLEVILDDEAELASVIDLTEEII